MGIDPELVSRALAEISKSRATYDYFFQRLSSPDWIAPLAERGLFQDPPPVEIDERGMISAPSWPPSQFLARVAAAAPEQVYDVLRTIDTSNERVRADLAKAAIVMPVDLLRGYAEREIEWLRLPENTFLYFLLPQALVAVIEKLMQAGAADVALVLAEELFRTIHRPQDVDESSATPRFSIWQYHDLLQRAARSMLEFAPEATLRLLRGLVEQAMPVASPVTFDYFEDQSQLWRPRLASDDRDNRDALQTLVSALRDAALLSRTKEAIADRALLDLLTSESTGVFRRVAAFAFSRPPKPGKTILERVLVDRKSFFASEPTAEYRELLGMRFGDLGTRGRVRLLEWIREGPDLAGYRRRRAASTGTEPSQEDLDSYAGIWRIQRLRLIQKQLPSDWQERYDDLVGQYGEAEFITSLEVSVSWGGPESPLSLEDLRAQSDDTILSLLESYEQHSSISGPSTEGLARILSTLSAEEPDRISRLAPRMAGLRPIHIQWTLIGLVKAIRDGKAVDWQALMELFRLIGAKLNGHDSTQDEDSYGRWRQTRQEVAEVLEAGFGSSTYAIPFQLREAAWQTLAPISEDVEPSEEYEQRYGGSNMDPATVALNTIRGRALHATIAYALWVHRNVNSLGDQPEGSFAIAPEVRAVLDRHLDPQVDPSPAIRSIYGQRFPWLALLDEAWASASAELVFTNDPGASVLRDAAWQSYVMFCPPYNDMFRILRNQYSDAVDRLGNEPPAWRWIGGTYTPKEHLAAHLLTFYWRGLVGLREGDEILERMFLRASPHVRASGIQLLGRALCETEGVDEETVNRVKTLWEWRIEAAEHEGGEDFLTEIAAFSWWAGAEALEPQWRLTQLERVLALGASSSVPSVVFDALGRLVQFDSFRAIGVLQAFLRLEVADWTIAGSQSEIEQILRVGLESGRHDTIGRAVAVVHWLGSLGYSNFRDLLRPAAT